MKVVSAENTYENFKTSDSASMCPVNIVVLLLSVSFEIVLKVWLLPRTIEIMQNNVSYNYKEIKGRNNILTEKCNSLEQILSESESCAQGNNAQKVRQITNGSD